jgi:hypothetical protein
LYHVRKWPKAALGADRYRPFVDAASWCMTKRRSLSLILILLAYRESHREVRVDYYFTRRPKSILAGHRMLKRTCIGRQIELLASSLAFKRQKYPLVLINGDDATKQLLLLEWILGIRNKVGKSDEDQLAREGIRK